MAGGFICFGGVLAGSGCLENQVHTKVMAASTKMLTCEESKLESVTESTSLSVSNLVHGFDVIGCGQVAHFICENKFQDVPGGSTEEFSCVPFSVYECPRQACLGGLPDKLRPQLEGIPSEDTIDNRRKFLHASLAECGCKQTWCKFGSGGICATY